MTTAKQAIAYGHISRAVVLAAAEGLTGYEATLLRIQDEDMLGRDLTRAERNALRGVWFGLPPEVTETEQCA